MRTKIFVSISRLLFVGAFLAATNLPAQPTLSDTGYIKGCLLVKSKRALSPDLLDGKIKTGIQSLDTLFVSLNVSGIEPIFPFNPNISTEKKAAYFKNGLDKYYVVKLPDSLDLHSTKNAL